MSRHWRYTVAIVLPLTGAGCGAHHGSAAAPSDPFSRIPVAAVPVASLAGSSVLVLAVGTLAVGDSGAAVGDLEARRQTLLDAANAALDSALRRDGRDVHWMGLEEQRRAVRRNPTLGLEPDRFATAYLFDPRVDRIPDPLWAQVRTLAAITGARFAVAPAAARLAGQPGALSAAFVLVVADTRTGQVLWRGRAQGRPAATAEAALALAAGTAIAAPLH